MQIKNYSVKQPSSRAGCFTRHTPQGFSAVDVRERPCGRQLYKQRHPDCLVHLMGFLGPRL